jgi:phenylacetate-CoA ligase
MNAVLQPTPEASAGPAARSLYTRLVAGVVFPLHERLKGHDTVRVRRGLEESQWWPRERLADLQLARLRALLADAAAHVPYYRDVLREARVDPASLSSLADLQRLPFLTKSVIRANLERLKSERARDLARFNTGGSSGEPLIFFIGKERVSHDVAAKWRATRWWGVDIGDPEIVVWGSPIEVGAQDRMRALRDRVLRTKLLPAFEMSESKLDGFVQAIRAMRPKMLFGYPSSLSLIARHAERRGVGMGDLGILVAFCTSERLYDHQRQDIGRVFGCRVANGYGGRDAGFIAHECPEGGMHITAEDIVVETVRPDGSPAATGEAGEIVVTHLATGEFPFIRYRTGDVGVLDDTACPCGRGLPLLKEIQGRTTDFVVARDGTVMHGLALIYVLRDQPGIRAFKIVQESLDRTRVLVEPAEGFRDEQLVTIEHGLQARLGAGVRVEVELVPQIAPEKSGKFRYVVSHVAV